MANPTSRSLHSASAGSGSRTRITARSIAPGTELTSGNAAVPRISGFVGWTGITCAPCAPIRSRTCVHWARLRTALGVGGADHDDGPGREEPGPVEVAEGERAPADVDR